MINLEKWKNIKGYEGFYQVSNQGRVYSIKDDKIINEYINNHGYKFVVLSKYKFGWKSYYVHRLVAEAFVNNSNIKEYNVVNHINEDKLDNSYDNLEWTTREENARLANSISVKCVETNKVYRSMTEAAKECNTHVNSISCAVRGKNKTAAKLHWVYASEGEVA